MSRAYRLRVSESLRRVVQAEDGLCSRLELLPLLAPEELGGLLAEELARRGFTRDGDVSLRTEADGVRVAIDTRTGEVSVTLAGEQAVELSASVERRYFEEHGREQAEAQAREQARAGLEERGEDAREHLREDLTRRLEARLRELKPELDGVTNRVTAEALKVRARRLGTVEEIHEDAATGSLTIKVRL